MGGEATGRVPLSTWIIARNTWPFSALPALRMDGLASVFWVQLRQLASTGAPYVLGGQIPPLFSLRRPPILAEEPAEEAKVS